LTAFQAIFHAWSQYHVFLLAQDARRSEIFPLRSTRAVSLCAITMIH
jgi:hypothetical protein